MLSPSIGILTTQGVPYIWMHIDGRGLRGQGWIYTLVTQPCSVHENPFEEWMPHTWSAHSASTGDMLQRSSEEPLRMTGLVHGVLWSWPLALDGRLDQRMWMRKD